MKVKFYRVYKVLTDDNGNIVHRTPMAKTNSLANARTHARVWNGVIYAHYTDDTEKLI